MTNNNYTIIADLEKKLEIEDNNLIIVEDADDTKQSTILELKKSFSGDYDEPSETSFYSSKKVQGFIDNIQRQSSKYAYRTEVEDISNRVNNIIAHNGSDDNTEIVDARDNEDTLYKRLERDINNADNRFMKKIHKVIEGTRVSTGNKGNVDIYINNITEPKLTVTFTSKNIFDFAKTNTSNAKFTDTGFTFSETDENNLSVLLTQKKYNSKVFNAGRYFFYADIIYDAIFQDKGNIILAVQNPDDESAYTEFVYDQSAKFEFYAPRAFKEIKIIFNQNKYVPNSTIEFKDIMLMKTEETDKEYIAPYKSSINYVKDNLNSVHFNIYNKNYDIECSDKNAIMRVEYYENSITTETLQNDIDELKSVIINNRDRCGLIQNYGQYLFFDDAVCETPTSCIFALDNDMYSRNGVSSLQVTFKEDIELNPVFALQMKEYVENIDSVTLVFYIDKTISHYFTASNPITLYLCSDSYSEPDMVNYLSVDISKNELLQGWNIIKKNISEFTTHGKPNEHGILYTKMEISKNSGLDNKSMYFNAVIFNQKLKPTVLLAFDGIYDEGIGYTYPYLTTRKVPATILSNNRTTFSKTTLDHIVNLRARYGWDLGQYGCNPNKELLTQDDNPREQYLALRNAKEWLKDNLVYDPMSYSAPFGNLRPITVPLLKDLGYKIAKTDVEGYCNFFDPRYDFAIPSVLMSNETSEQEIINKIQYAIDNECCICLYTNNVTAYGDESNMKKTLLESVIDFIQNNSGKITMMTFSEFYNKCSM